jgi:Ca2+-transporting ATPase
VFGTLMLNVMLLILANRNLTRPAFLSAMAPTPWLGLVRVVGRCLIRARPTT